MKSRIAPCGGNLPSLGRLLAGGAAAARYETSADAGPGKKRLETAAERDVRRCHDDAEARRGKSGPSSRGPPSPATPRPRRGPSPCRRRRGRARSGSRTRPISVPEELDDREHGRRDCASPGCRARASTRNVLRLFERGFARRARGWPGRSPPCSQTVNPSGFALSAPVDEVPGSRSWSDRRPGARRRVGRDLRRVDEESPRPAGTPVNTSTNPGMPVVAEEDVGASRP